MKVIYTLILVLMAGTAYGQSNLPACQGSDATRWSKCFGSWTASNGYSYVGEWLESKQSGKGTASYANGDKYIGESKNGFPNGLGVFAYASGDKYIGEFKDGKKHGQGTYLSGGVETGKGEWINDAPNGSFIEYRPDGNILRSGVFKEGKFISSQYIDPNSFTKIPQNKSFTDITEGQWVATFPSKCKSFTQISGEIKIQWNGGCVDNLIDGKGSLSLFKDGNLVYTANANFSRGSANGHATFEYVDGEKYIGEMINGKKNGKGILTSKINGTYEGLFRNGLPNGLGQASFPNGDNYVGDFKDGLMDGGGAYSFAIGDKYIGENKNNMPNGQGTYYFLASNQNKGDKYVGEYKDGNRNGQGTYIYANGYRHIGEYQDGKLNGRGIKYSANGSIQESGIYKDDGLVTSQYIDPNSFTRIAKNDTAPAVSDSQRQEADQLKAQLEEERRLRRVEEAKRKEAEEKNRQAVESNQLKPNIASNVGTDKRIALVIGNAKYQSSPLRNPINDANDISNALKQSGFEVIDVRDANLQQMRSAVRNFGDRLISSDVGLVYYSGHGIESKGRNYFIPVNTDIQRDDEIADQGLDVSLILDKMTTAGKGVNILIVDACRNDPFSRGFRSTSKGLAAMDAPKGTIIAYATSPGKLASDGDPKARNSPYTKHLLAAMQVPNRPIEMVFKEVRRNVQNDTKNEQTPWENTSLSGDFYFRVQK